MKRMKSIHVDDQWGKNWYRRANRSSCRIFGCFSSFSSGTPQSDGGDSQYSCEHYKQETKDEIPVIVLVLVEASVSIRADSLECMFHSGELVF